MNWIVPRQRKFHYDLKVINDCLDGLIRNAKERRPGALGYAEAMLIAYNAKNKYRLSMKRLYGNSSDEDTEAEDSDEDIDELI